MRAARRWLRLEDTDGRDETLLPPPRDAEALERVADERNLSVEETVEALVREQLGLDELPGRLPS